MYILFIFYFKVIIVVVYKFIKCYFLAKAMHFLVSKNTFSNNLLIHGQIYYYNGYKFIKCYFLAKAMHFLVSKNTFSNNLLIHGQIYYYNGYCFIVTSLDLYIDFLDFY